MKTRVVRIEEWPIDHETQEFTTESGWIIAQINIVGDSFGETCRAIITMVPDHER
jgi:hypothetical protein